MQFSIFERIVLDATSELVGNPLEKLKDCIQWAERCKEKSMNSQEIYLEGDDIDDFLLCSTTKIKANSKSFGTGFLLHYSNTIFILGMMESCLVWGFPNVQPFDM